MTQSECETSSIKGKLYQYFVKNEGTLPIP